MTQWELSFVCDSRVVQVRYELLNVRRFSGDGPHHSILLLVCVRGLINSVHCGISNMVSS